MTVNDLHELDHTNCSRQYLGVIDAGDGPAYKAYHCINHNCNYKELIEVEAESYTLTVLCSNCGWMGDIQIPKGIPLNTQSCQECGVPRLTRHDGPRF